MVSKFAPRPIQVVQLLLVYMLVQAQEMRRFKRLALHIFCRRWPPEVLVRCPRLNLPDQWITLAAPGLLNPRENIPAMVCAYSRVIRPRLFQCLVMPSAMLLLTQPSSNSSR